MNETKEPRSYQSSIRERQSLETRERILKAVGDLMVTDPEQAFSIDDVARQAGVNRRTVFRHFADKGQLIDAFWAQTNRGLGVQFWPRSEADLIRLPESLFEALESIGGIVRASHLSAAGREMLLRANIERQAAFRESLASVTADMSALRARQLQATIQLLFSATAWQTMRDYWGLSAREAGEACSWAIEAILKAAKEAPPASDGESGQGGPGHEGAK